MMMFIKRVYFYMFLLAPSLWLVSGQDKLNIKQAGPLVIKVDTPPPPGSSILWKINANKVVEYDKDFPDQGITAYGPFKGRTTLNRTTGELKVTSLTKADNGVYSVEYNSKVQSKRFLVSVFKTVPKPTITSNCDESPTSCTLTCVGDTTDAGEVAYSWKKNGEPLTGLEPTLQITSKEAVEFTCQFSNSVSKEESDPLKNPLYQSGLSPWGIVAIIAVVLGAAGGLAYLVFRKFSLQGPKTMNYTSAGGNNADDPVTTNTNDSIVPPKTSNPDLHVSTEDRQGNATVPANVTTVYGVVCGNAEGDGATTNTNNHNGIEVNKAQPSSDEVPLSTLRTPDLHGNTEDRQSNAPKEDRPANDPETGPLKKSDDEDKGEGESDKL